MGRAGREGGEGKKEKILINILVHISYLYTVIFIFSLPLSSKISRNIIFSVTSSKSVHLFHTVCMSEELVTFFSPLFFVFSVLSMLRITDFQDNY